MTHGELVNKLLRFRNMTPAALSRQAGINRQTVYSIINKNQKRTSSSIYKSFAIALDVPEYIFESSNEENAKLLEEWFENEPLFKDNSQKKSVPSDTYLLDLMQEYHRSPEFILDGLKYISIYNRYATYDINKLLQNAYHYDKGLFNYLDSLIKYGICVTKSEYHIIENLRSLDPDKQQTICTLIEQLMSVSGELDNNYPAKPIEKVVEQ